jgi:hypothetical protein
MPKIRRDRNAKTAAMKNKEKNKIKENMTFQSK